MSGRSKEIKKSGSHRDIFRPNFLSFSLILPAKRCFFSPRSVPKHSGQRAMRLRQRLSRPSRSADRRVVLARHFVHFCSTERRGCPTLQIFSFFLSSRAPLAPPMAFLYSLTLSVSAPTVAKAYIRSQPTFPLKGLPIRFDNFCQIKS